MSSIQNSPSKTRYTSFLKERSSKTYKIVDFILITVFILVLANGIPQLIGNSFFSLSILILSIGVFIQRKRKMDNFFWVFLVLWILINFISNIRNTIDDLAISTYISRTIKMIVPYFLIKSIGSSFFEKFFRYAYVLAILSIPIFLLQLAIPSLFASIAPLFSFMTGAEQVAGGGFYSFVYMFAWGGAHGRNAGFMWEPGAFAGILIFLIFYYWARNGVRINTKVSLLLLALLTTVSTSGYFALFFAILFYIYSFKKNANTYLLSAFFFVAVVVGSIYFYNTSEFMSGKVDIYLEQGDEHWGINHDGALRLSRLGIILVSIDDFLHYPFGNGFLLSDYMLNTHGNVEGPSALASILREWGVLSIIMIVLTFKYWTKIFKLKPLGGALFAISISFLLFSNPDGFKTLVYSIFFYAFIYKGHTMVAAPLKPYINTKSK